MTLPGFHNDEHMSSEYFVFLMHASAVGSLVNNFIRRKLSISARGELKLKVTNSTLLILLNFP